MSAHPGPYSLCTREHANAGELLRELGAWQEIEAAVLGHCRDSAPAAPAYNPQALKKHLVKSGWTPAVRVPPMTAAHDERRINDRYDAWKAFDRGSSRVGVAIEIEHWEVNNDLLKFRRGQERGQIIAGVVIHADPEEVCYAYEHCLKMAEPLWADLTVLFCSPEGPGLPAYGLKPVKALNYGPFVYP
jgi:hypothetical protein